MATGADAWSSIGQGFNSIMNVLRGTDDIVSNAFNWDPIFSSSGSSSGSDESNFWQQFAQDLLWSVESQREEAAATNAFNAEQALLQRNFNAAEAEKARQFNAEQAAIDRQFQINSANMAMNFEANEAEKLRTWQEAQNQKAMDYSTEMANTAYQRAVKDLQAAGLNPILAYTNGGAATPSGVTSSGKAASGFKASSSAASGPAASGSSASGVQANVRGYITELTDALSNITNSASKLVSTFIPSKSVQYRYTFRS